MAYRMIGIPEDGVVRFRGFDPAIDDLLRARANDTRCSQGPESWSPEDAYDLRVRFTERNGVATIVDVSAGISTDDESLWTRIWPARAPKSPDRRLYFLEDRFVKPLFAELFEYCFNLRPDDFKEPVIPHDLDVEIFEPFEQKTVDEFFGEMRDFGSPDEEDL